MPNPTYLVVSPFTKTETVRSFPSIVNTLVNLTPWPPVLVSFVIRDAVVVPSGAVAAFGVTVTPSIAWPAKSFESSTRFPSHDR